MRCVEDALREVQGKAALIEFLANCALEARHLPEPDAATFSGLGDVAAEIKTLIARIQGALDVDALGRGLRNGG